MTGQITRAALRGLIKTARFPPCPPLPQSRHPPTPQSRLPTPSVTASAATSLPKTALPTTTAMLVYTLVLLLHSSSYLSKLICKVPLLFFPRKAQLVMSPWLKLKSFLSSLRKNSRWATTSVQKVSFSTLNLAHVCTPRCTQNVWPPRSHLSVFATASTPPKSALLITPVRYLSHSSFSPLGLEVICLPFSYDYMKYIALLVCLIFFSSKCRPSVAWFIFHVSLVYHYSII